jgi:hypothetical protein
MKMEIVALTQVCQGISDKTGRAESKGSHGDDKAFARIRVGCSARMQAFLKHQDPQTGLYQPGGSCKSPNARTNDNDIARFQHGG